MSAETTSRYQTSPTDKNRTIARSVRKDRSPQDGPIFGYVPLPESEIDCELFRTLSEILTLPLFEPVEVGLKLTPITHVAPGARVVLLVQFVPATVANAKLPLTERPERISGVVPEFLGATDFAVVPVF